MNFLNLFLQKEKQTPLYYQLYRHIAQGVMDGDLPKGEKLPGKRTAAAQLGVSVNTVDQAYQMLAAEGYVTAHARSGFVVNRVEAMLPAGGQTAKKTMPQKSEKAATKKYSFATGDIDPALFPRKTWNRLLREVLSEDSGLFARGEGAGEEELRLALAAYLKEYRGVRCDAGQIVVGAGLEVLVGMLARLYAGGLAALENPGYPKTMHILNNNGLKTLPLAIDDFGMRRESLEKAGASLAYLTPSHQYPTGQVMPVGRRMELLQWAAEGDRLLVEDDYDSEFRFDGRPLPSLQGMDHAGCVVYAGTFSRSLAPGLRAAYMVLPPKVLQRWRQAYGEYACTVSRPEQRTLARFLQGGYFARNLNRMRVTYKERREWLVNALKQSFVNLEYTTENLHTGLYFVARLHNKNATAIAKKARENGIAVRALAEYSLDTKEKMPSTEDALVLGYGGFSSAQQAIQAVDMLAQIAAQI